ncbi:MAG: PAS domain S-box protein [Desulfovibrio sp.]|uniref:PAS domain S-box protein n=1 Tax=Desulfovibrio sp. 7SRBS1 TaxID=3378064 RepID=UPI003B4020FA
MGAVNIRTGILLLRFPTSKAASKFIPGITLILWGIHKFNYPMLRPIEWIAPWGYLIGTFLAFLLALGIIIVHFEKIQSRLNESEERFRWTFDKAAMGIANISPQGRFIQVNRAICSILGYTSDELLGMNIKEVTHPGDLDKGTAVLQQAIAEHQDHYSFEKRYINRAGKTVWASETTSIINDETQNLEYFVKVIEDISERKKAEERIHDLARFPAENPNPVLRLSRDGELIYANKASQPILDAYDLKPQEVIMPGHLAERLLEAMHPNEEFEICVDSKWYAFTSSFSKFSRSINLYGMDVTERKKADQALKDSEKRFRRLFEESLHGICIFEDMPPRFSLVNSAFCKLIGRSMEELLAFTPGQVWTLVHPEDRALVRERLLKRMQGEKATSRYDFRFIKPDGTVGWVEVAVSSQLISGKIASQAIFRDITKKRQQKEWLTQAKNLAVSASRAKSEFLANISHEIRTPLNGLLGMLQLLGTTEQSPEQKEYTRIASDAGNSLMTLLGDLLDLSRIESGKMELISQPFSMLDTSTTVLNTMQAAAEQKGVALTLHVDEEIPPLLLGDAGRFRQVLFNLVGNAVKFTEAGSVHIAIHPLPYTQNEQSLYFVEITDTGPGIPDNMLDSIFRPFEQGNLSYSQRPKGAGLGLAIVSRLISLMQGTICVDSTLGKGTSIIFTIKAQRGDQLEALEKAAPPSPMIPTGKEAKPEGLRILVAEDNAVNLFFVEKLLRKMGHHPTSAADGKQALSILSKQKFDLVLMDIQMPVMDGLEATKAIRDGGVPNVPANLPVVAMTAHAMAGDREKFLAAGMTDYIAKPVDQSHLESIFLQMATWKKEQK